MHDTFQQLANDVLVWIGFGTVVGLLAKGIMPGRDPGGAIATVMMGVGGSILGCGVVSYFNEGQRITPISPLGMLVATLGALLILFFYKMLGGYYFLEGEYVTRQHRRSRLIAGRREHFQCDVKRSCHGRRMVWSIKNLRRKTPLLIARDVRSLPEKWARQAKSLQSAANAHFGANGVRSM